MNYINDNICALATPQGAGAIGIVRLSGSGSIEIIDRFFTALSGRNMADTVSNKMVYGTFSANGKLLDECMVALFRAPHSYTGENSVEIYCHGSSYILGEVLKALLGGGARMAEPGEFSKRAFLNGKMDLAQTEAVADLIASETEAAHKVAMQQMRGCFSNELKEMRQQLLHLVSLMELELDFSEEDVEFADRSQLKVLVAQVLDKVSTLAESFSLGNVIKNGVPVAIIGATNTGKSTLLNTLLGEEKAIVSNIHGTTRDVVEDTINLNGITFRFTDTAGIRETKETIEMIGIERTYMKLKQASIIIMVLDASRQEFFEDSLMNLSSRMNRGRQKLIVALNKSDIFGDAALGDAEPGGVALGDAALSGVALGDAAPGDAALSDAAPGGAAPGDAALGDAALGGVALGDAEPGDAALSDAVPGGGKPNYRMVESGTSAASDLAVMVEQIKEICSRAGLSPIAVLPISAKKGVKVDELKSLLVSTQNINVSDQNSTLVTNLRHYEALLDAQRALDRVEDGLTAGIPTDLVSQDIREAMYHLGSIVGEIDTEEILGNIFSKFCIGK